MKNKVGWIVLGVLCLASFVLTFVKTPEAITSMLETVAKETRGYAAFVHLLFLAVLGLGLLTARLRNLLFSLFIAFLSLSATVFAVKYVIAPNVIIFGMFFVLVLHAWLTKQLDFDLKHSAPIDLFFGIFGLVFGFWYLHWVESPVWLNALFASPLGVVNCPTMVTVCGFLCLSQKPRSALLEAAVGIVTLYFGFFGIFRLGAYVDVALVLCALFLLVRLIASLRHAHASEENVALAAARP
ncbi:MAG TPA: hypothetical protein VLZ03_10815 [Thermodesulfobacteriota bacterium]|nr:hypothetical protein [Thermodesulfobacteriota bacterium]